MVLIGLFHLVFIGVKELHKLVVRDGGEPCTAGMGVGGIFFIGGSEVGGFGCCILLSC